MNAFDSKKRIAGRSPVIGLLGALYLTGCALGPDYERPAGPIPEGSAFLNTPAEGSETLIPSMSEWWRQIDDPSFTRDVESLLRDNLTLRAAAERVIQADERLAIQSGGRWPTVSAAGSANRGFTTTTAKGVETRHYTSTTRLDLSVAWTLDLFGQNLRSIEAREASLGAAVADREALNHLLIAELLKRRVAIAVNQELLASAQASASNRERLYELVKLRYDLGATGTRLTDVFLAQDNYASLQSDVAELERQLMEETYRLDVLLGRRPGSAQSTASRFPLLDPPPDAPQLLPASLLDRRPDLRAAELRVRAANANIGVAIADLYPKFNITGSYGVTNPQIGNLPSSESLAGSLLGSISHALFAGGSLRANIRLQESTARELASNYAAAVLDAVREVESALQSDRRIAEQLAAQGQSLDAIRKAERLSFQRYREGLQPLQAYLEIEQRRHLTEQNWLRTQQRRWSTRIALYLALGGDWVVENPL